MNLSGSRMESRSAPSPPQGMFTVGSSPIGIAGTQELVCTPPDSPAWKAAAARAEAKAAKAAKKASKKPSKQIAVNFPCCPSSRCSMLTLPVMRSALCALHLCCLVPSSCAAALVILPASYDPGCTSHPYCISASLHLCIPASLHLRISASLPANSLYL